VESAVLIGAPVPSDAAAWRRLRAMVVGRLVNVYATKDFLLGFLYRARSAQLGVAGLQLISGVPGVENRDVTDIVTGHNQYRLAVGVILQEVQFTDLDLVRVGKEEQELEAEKIKEKEAHDEAKRKGLLKVEEDEDGQIKMADVSAVEAPWQEMDGKERRHPDSLFSAMRDLHGLDLGQQTSGQEANTQLTRSQELKPKAPEGELPEEKTQEPDLQRETTKAAGRQQDPLTPTTSDDEDDESHGKPIQMMDLEPEPEPNTPPRQVGRR